MLFQKQSGYIGWEEFRKLDFFRRLEFESDFLNDTESPQKILDDLGMIA